MTCSPKRSPKDRHPKDLLQSTYETFAENSYSSKQKPIPTVTHKR